MNRRFGIRARARLDIFDQQEWYLSQNAFDIAERFIDAVIEGAQNLAEFPGSGRPESFESPGLAGLRSWSIPGFGSMRIYYLSLPSGIEILRILHSARDVLNLLEPDL